MTIELVDNIIDQLVNTKKIKKITREKLITAKVDK